jgi:hypothetical protein
LFCLYFCCAVSRVGSLEEKWTGKDIGVGSRRLSSKNRTWTRPPSSATRDSIASFGARWGSCSSILIAGRAISETLLIPCLKQTRRNISGSSRVRRKLIILLLDSIDMRIHRPVGDGVNDAVEPGGSQALQRMCLALFNIYSNFLPDSGPAFTGRAVNNSLAVTSRRPSRVQHSASN